MNILSIQPKIRGFVPIQCFCFDAISEKEKLVFINSALIEYKIGHGGDKE